MLKPSVPIDETERLKRLHTLKIMDTPRERRYDRISRMARRHFDVDICLISLIDANRQWFKSRQGLEASEFSRNNSFCGHTIMGHSVFVVPNASADLRFHDNPLVTGGPEIRFYAGYPIHDPEGYPVGTLCIIDSAPREMSAENIESLKDLAAMVDDEVKVSAQVTVDELTTVANRRGFHMIANHLLSLCRRTGTAAELAFFDLDGFRIINETHGYSSGDLLLQHFAKLLMCSFRAADAIGRLGGDEFVVLLTGSERSARPALARLREMASTSGDRLQRNLRWSVGNIQFDPGRHDTLECLLADADSCMYDDKVRRRRIGAC